MLDAISPIDGRYASKTAPLKEYFSEYALIKYRIRVEIEYFIHLVDMGVVDCTVDAERLRAIYMDLTPEKAQRVKEIEKVTNHDVKAVEYYIKEELKDVIAAEHLEFIHFGLTSQDINNTATPLMIKEALQKAVMPLISEVLELINDMSEAYKDYPLLSRTHGQAASPSTVGKEMKVYVDRLDRQLLQLVNAHHSAKFGGATGNFNAHKVSYPNHDWPQSITDFIAGLGLVRQQTTTQIEHYDSMAEIFHTMSRINTIFVDFCRDIWTYISMNYFTQKVVANEVGSSAMPHKVNPIDFENAEGNLTLANATLQYLANKLPVSRLQRDLTDSTVSRNIGVPFGHVMIACLSMKKGIGKLQINKAAIDADLERNWAVVAEGIQTVLRREGFEKPYELLKAFSRGKGQLSKDDFTQFINELAVSDAIKEELHAITPYNYIGYAAEM